MRSDDLQSLDDSDGFGTSNCGIFVANTCPRPGDPAGRFSASSEYREEEEVDAG
jgi:hypothetical protein